MASILDEILGGAGEVMDTLDAPGSYLRGVLGGRLGDRLSGRDMLEEWGVLGANEEGLDLGDILGFAAELPTDPFNWLGAGVGRSLLKGGAKAFGRDITGEGLERTAYSGFPVEDDGLLRHHMAQEFDDIGAFSPRHARRATQTADDSLPPQYDSVYASDPVNQAFAWSEGSYPQGEEEARVAAKLFEQLSGSEPPIPGMLPRQTAEGVSQYSGSRPGQYWHEKLSNAPRGIDQAFATSADQLSSPDGPLPFDILRNQYTNVMSRGANKLGGIEREIAQIERELLEDFGPRLDPSVAEELGYRGRDIIPMRPVEGAAGLQAKDADFGKWRPETRERFIEASRDAADFLVDDAGDMDPEDFEFLRDAWAQPSRLERDLMYGHMEDPYFSKEAQLEADLFDELYGIPPSQSMPDVPLDPRAQALEDLNRQLSGIDATMTGSTPPSRPDAGVERFLDSSHLRGLRDMVSETSGIGWQGEAGLQRQADVQRALEARAGGFGSASETPQGMALDQLRGQRDDVAFAMNDLRSPGLGGVEGPAIDQYLSGSQMAARQQAMGELEETRRTLDQIMAGPEAEARAAWEAPLRMEYGTSLDPERIRELTERAGFIESLRAQSSTVPAELVEQARREMAEDAALRQLWESLGL